MVMIKILYTFKNNPNLTEEQCDKHYHAVHIPLAKKALGPGCRRYSYAKVVKHTINDKDGNVVETKPDFDCFVEVFFDTREAMEKAFASPEMEVSSNDMQNFADVGTLKVYEFIQEIPINR
jgi:uncharacterized protein (TIGR02118 family)